MSKPFSKVFTYLLIIWYVLIGTGLGIKSHFCMGKLKSVTFSLIESKDCCNLKGKKSKCCQNHTKVFVFNEKQERSNLVTLTAKLNFQKYKIPFKIYLFDFERFQKIEKKLIEKQRLAFYIKKPPIALSGGLEKCYILTHSFLI